jgi:uncharacterized damage-inducible protein DinB
MTCPICQQEHNWTLEDALDRIAKGPATIREAMAKATPEELLWKPAPNKWSVQQVAVHLLDTEMVYGVRIRKILAEDNPPLIAYEQDLWAEHCAEGRDVERVMQAFELLRADNVDLFRASLTRLGRAGQHPQYGALSARDLVMHLSPHDEKHAGQIQRVRQAYMDTTR